MSLGMQALMVVHTRGRFGGTKREEGAEERRGDLLDQLRLDKGNQPAEKPCTACDSK